MIDIVERLRDTKHHPWEICQDAADEIASLRRALDDLGVTPQEARAGVERSKAKVALLVAQLAESRARELRLREWMDWNAEHATHCIRVQEDERGCTCGLSELLTLQQDDSALREMIEAAKAAEREACAKACEDIDVGESYYAAAIRSRKG